MKVANKDCRKWVEDKQEFKGSNLDSVKLSDSIYVVYSYGWYPLWACIGGKWYGHNSKYSMSTSKQRTQSMPSCCTILDTVDDLKQIINENM